MTVPLVPRHSYSTEDVFGRRFIEPIETAMTPPTKKNGPRVPVLNKNFFWMKLNKDLVINSEPTN
jgi:hypothetical protein